MSAKPPPGEGPTEHPSPTSGKDTKPNVAPRLPHERDESADRQTSGPRSRIKRARVDIENGLVAIDIGTVLDSVYEREMYAESERLVRVSPARARCTP